MPGKPKKMARLRKQLRAQATSCRSNKRSASKEQTGHNEKFNNNTMKGLQNITVYAKGKEELNKPIRDDDGNKD